MNIKKFVNNLKFIDPIFLVCITVVFCFGLSGIYSVSLAENGIDLFVFKKQLLLFFISLILFFLFSICDQRTLKQYALISYITCAILLLCVLLFGRTIRGTTGWFVIGIFQIQPVEFAKISLILVLAHFFSNRSRAMDRFLYVIYSAIFPAILVFLVLLQPDLGSSVVLLVIWLFMLWANGIKWRYFLGIIGGGILCSLLAWFFLLAPFQKNRILTFIDPSLDPLGSGYNVIQSMIAVGSGGIFGQGLGQGTQGQLRFLPEAHTDFLFAVLAEELGFIGISILLIVWIVFFYRLLVLIKQVDFDFDVLVIVGAISWFLFQIVQNIGMNMGIMPVTGLALPLMSAGGSSLMANMIMLGIIASIMINHRQKQKIIKT